MIEKDEEFILTKEKMCEYKSKNDSLLMQVHGLKQVLAASGSGEIAKELTETQEKLSTFQAQYYEVIICFSNSNGFNYYFVLVAIREEDLGGRSRKIER